MPNVNQPRGQYGSGNVRFDELGTMVPFGGGSGEKELIRLPKELEKLATSANTILRGRLSKEVGTLLALLNVIGSDDDGTKSFTGLIIAATMAEGGLARSEYLMGLARMLVPSSMPSTYAVSHDGHDQRDHNQKNKKDGDNE